MEHLLNNLSSSINLGNEQDIIDNLQPIIKGANELKIDELGTFKKLLKNDSKPVLILGCQSIAELCMDIENRNVFTDEEVIKELMQFMESGSNELIFNATRAIGNICYENAEASEMVNKSGINNILQVLKNDSARDDNSLTTKVSGLLVNLLDTHDDLPKTALREGILPIVKALLIKYKEPLEENQTLIAHLLKILNVLTDYLDDKEFIFSEDLAKVVVDIFKTSEIPEISLVCLEIFHALAEKDEIKSLLAREGVCELLYTLIEKYRDKVNDEDSRAILKMVCDLIVLILTGDSSMNLLYDNGNGKTYQNMLTWLSCKDSDLLSTGILAIGNFARKDMHCIQMVKNGVAKKLINILQNYNQSTDINDVKVQHALLSTLKNLVIPKENKAQALKDDIIEVMYPMLKQTNFLVIFKLLGTFRMVIDGQPEAALNLLSRKDFIERLVYWCYNSDHLGVRGEVPRIFAWLIKNVQISTPFSTFISVPDSVKCIVEMASSNHGVMQNESFFALTLLAVGLSNCKKHSTDEIDSFYRILCEADIGKNVYFVINKYAEKWDQHTIENCLSLLEIVKKSDQLLSHLKDNNISDALLKLKTNDNAKCNLIRVNDMIEFLEK